MPRGRSRPPARPRAPALGNDPFERGAAQREPAAPAIGESTLTTIPADDAATASSTATPTPTATATPTPTATATPTSTAFFRSPRA